MFPVLLDFSAPVEFCKVLHAAIEKCLFMRCGNVMALQIRELVFGISNIPGSYTVLDHFFWVRLGALKHHDVLFRCVLFACVPMPFYLQPFAFVGRLIVLWVCQWKPFSSDDILSGYEDLVSSVARS